MDEVLIAVEIPLLGDERRRNWAKVVEAVDEAKTTGWAYQGEFIAVGGVQDVPAGSVVLVYGEKGSRSNPQVEARVYTANPDATLSEQGRARGKAWARTLRDVVTRALDNRDGVPLQPIEWGPELMKYSDDALREELRRRGVD